MNADCIGDEMVGCPDTAVQSVETALLSTAKLIMEKGSGLLMPVDRRSVGQTCF